MVSASVPVGTLAVLNLLAVNQMFTEQTPTNLGVVVACTSFVGWLLWKVRGAVDKVNTSLKELHKDSEEARTCLIKQNKKLVEIEDRVKRIEESCPEVNVDCGKHKCK